MNCIYGFRKAFVMSTILVALLIVSSPLQAQTDQYAAYNKIKAQLRDMKAQDVQAYSAAQAAVNKADLPRGLKGIPPGASADEVHAVVFFNVFKQQFQTADSAVQAAAAKRKALDAHRTSLAPRVGLDPIERHPAAGLRTAADAAAKQIAEDNASPQKGADDVLARRQAAYAADPEVRRMREREKGELRAYADQQAVAAEAAQQDAARQAVEKTQRQADAARQQAAADAAAIQKSIDATDLVKQGVLGGGDLSRLFAGLQQVAGLQQAAGVIANHSSGLQQAAGFGIQSMRGPSVKEALAILNRAVKANDRRAVLAALDTLKSSLQAAKDSVQRSR